MQEISLSQLMSSLSYALDITEGQPEGHCIRCCWIGMNIAEHLKIPEQEKWELYYVLLLKDLGCSSNASRICELYLTDDHAFKRNFKWVDGSLPQALRFLIRNTGYGKGFVKRLKTITNVAVNSEELAQELITTRCTRGADIARQLRFPEKVANGIHSLDEHWDGNGHPQQLAKAAIPLYARIALLAQVIDVINFSQGREETISEIKKRQSSWFDPDLVKIFVNEVSSNEFWQTLNSKNVEEVVLNLPQGKANKIVDEGFLDDIAEAFGQVIDAKSPYTAGHSSRVSLYTNLLAEHLGISESRRRWLNRGALLHDVGKLGVSNTVLDKPGKLTDEEFKHVQNHAAFTQDILGRIDIFSELASVSSAHHERLDGKGYPLGLSGDEILMETRIITTADIFDAITATRPYRDATPVIKTLDIMKDCIGTSIDEQCFHSLRHLVETHPELFPE